MLCQYSELVEMSTVARSIYLSIYDYNPIRDPHGKVATKTNQNYLLTLKKGWKIADKLHPLSYKSYIKVDEDEYKTNIKVDEDEYKTNIKVDDDEYNNNIKVNEDEYKSYIKVDEDEYKTNIKVD